MKRRFTENKMRETQEGREFDASGDHTLTESVAP